MVADPDGLFEAWADDWSLMQNYRFGTGTCDFLICLPSGVFIAAVSGTAADARAVVNVNCLSERERFTSVPAVHDFEGETLRQIGENAFAVAPLRAQFEKPAAAFCMTTPTWSFGSSLVEDTMS